MAEIRTYVFLDVLQPQVAGFLATVSQGYLPIEGQSSLFLEISPGMEVNVACDAALKAAEVQPGMLIVEREFGILEVHSFDQGMVRAAGDAVLDRLGLTQEDRLAPVVVSAQTITGIDPHHSMLVNRMRHGDMILANQTYFVLETHPAGYAVFAANEAEKAANINILEFRAFGAFGRVYLGGTEAEIEQAAEAAIAGLKSLTGRTNPTAAAR